MSDEFSARLKKRLALGLKKDLYFTLTLWDAEYATDFVLRESGHAELVAALKNCRTVIERFVPVAALSDDRHLIAVGDVLAQIDAALKLAGEK